MKGKIRTQKGFTVVQIIITVAIVMALAGGLYIWVSNTMQSGGLGEETAPTAISSSKTEESSNDTEEQEKPQSETQQPVEGEVTPTSEDEADSQIPESTVEHEPTEESQEGEEEAAPEAEPSEYTFQKIFTVSPLDIDKIAGIVPLGNLNPPSHTFPTDHIYFHITRQDGADRPDLATLYAPGDMTVTFVRAMEHINAGLTDYILIMQPDSVITVTFIHVSSLDEEIFGDTSSFSDWLLDSEYTTGGELYRMWSKDYNIDVSAGQVLGTAGGNPGQWALDLGVYDSNCRQEYVANPERWLLSQYLYAVDPLYYFEEGPVLAQLLELVERDVTEEDRLPYGSVLQDLPGTAQGCWFLGGVEETYPEDLHLALVYSNINPSRAVISAGNSIANLYSDAYEFLSEDSGVLNRDFKEIVPDGQIYGFQVGLFDGIIIMQMPNAETLWVEALVGASIEPTSWSFTGNKTIFVR